MPGSNVSANVTYFSNTYELGSANVFYINGAGTYDLEMSGSNVFALSNTVVNTITNLNSYTNTKGVHVGSDVNTAYYAKTTSTFSNNILIGDKNYSVSYWINVTASALSQAESAHIWWGNYSANNVMRLGFRENNGKKTLSLQNGSCAGNIEITPDVWHHIVLARQSSPASWISYVDGVRDDMGNGSQGYVSANREMYIGYTTVDAGVGYIKEAYMDDISIWNKTLTQSDVDSIYVAGPSNLNSHTSATNLMAWWKFEDNGDDSATGSSNNLTINNTGWYSSSAVAKKYTISLDFDNYNKLTIENFTTTESDTRTAKLTDPNGDTYSLGQTQNDIYIKDQGDYFLEVTNSDQSAVVKKTVGTISTPPLGTNGYTFSDFQTEQRGESHDNVITFEKTDECTSTVGYWNTSDLHAHSGHTCIKWDSSVTYDAANNYGWSLVAGGCQSGVTLTISSGQMKYHVPSPWNHYFDFDSGRIAIPSPSLNFDNFNKLTIANVDSDATSNIDFFSNTYEMGSRKELIINDAGTYYANIYSSNTLALVKKQVTDTFPTTETQKIIESDRTNTYTGGTDDWFGIAVSISGDYAIVGSPYGDEDASNGNTLTSAGAAYIFKHNGTSWVEQQKIVPNVRESGFRFGWSVSISGDYVIVGTASTDGADAGEAYIFKRSATTSTWTQEYKLVASDASGDDQFGNSVSISGDYAIVGASYEDLSGSDGAGAAYIFKRSGVTWTEETKVVASDRAGGDKFGKSVSISGDYAIVGSHNEDHDVTGGNVLSNAGSAYIFKRSAATSTWTQETKIVASDRAVGDQFGWSVSISGDYAIVGSVYEDHDVTGGNVLSNAGSAYVFKRSGTTWTQETKIVASDRAGSDYFGASVSISGDYAIVGAHYEDHDFSGANYMSAAGSAYIFKRSGTTWTQTSKISASDRGGSDYFGYSVSISGNRSIVGAYGHDYDLNGANFVSQTGACYLFERPAIGPDTTITHEPTFTSASAVSTGESGWAVSASSQYSSSYVPWYAFNDGTGSWHSAEPDGGPHWLKIQLPTKKVLSGYDLKARDDSASLIRAPKTWVLEGSNDDSTWTELEPYHTNDESWTGGSTPPARQFSISTTTAYKYYRVYITLATDNNEAVAIGEFTLNIKPPASPALNFDGYNKLTLENFDSMRQWPPTDGTRSSPTWSDSDKVADWTITGASYGNGSYKGTSSVAVWSDSSNHAGPYWAFNNDDSTAENECWHPQSIVVAILTIEMPSSMVLGSYELYYRNYTSYTEGPKDWTVEGSNDGSTWTVLDTRTNQPQVSAALAKIGTYTVSNSTSYSKYRLNVTANHGGSQTTIGEWKMFSNELNMTLTKTPDSWDVGTASNVYIDAAGTYDAQAKNSNTFVIKTSNVVSAPVTRKFEWKADGTETQILLASDRDTNTQLGYDAAIDGDYIIGGGPQDDEGGSQAGAAYIFKKNGTSWSQTAKLIVSDAAANDQAGEFVNIFGDYAIIGVYTKSSSAGAAYIFKRDTDAETWTEQEKITASDAAASDKFGNSVSINSDYAIVGSPYNDSPDNSGSAYIFIRSGSSWTQQAKLTASDAASNDEFGLSVDISGDYVISGANSGDQRPGSAYIFKYDATYPPDDLPPVDSVGTGFNYKRYTALDTSTHYVYKMWRNSASDWRTPSPASANTIKVLKTDSTDWSDNDTTDTNPEYVDTTTYSGKVSLGQSAGPTENYRFSVPTFGIWNQQAKLQASDGATSDRFGKAVALSGDYAVIGAYADDSPSNSGSAYIFKKESTYVFTGTSPSTITLGGFWYTNFSRWYQKSTSDATSSYVRYILWNSSGQVGANYGTSFYTNSSGDLILDVNDSTGGSSTPFYFVNNTTSTTVSSGTGVVSVGDSIELFTSLNTSEATFTVPSVFAPTSGDVWSQQAKLLPSDAAGSDNFGWKVEISGDIAVIGAYHADPGGVSNAGSAYIFERSGTTWTEIKKLTASTHATTDGRFGEGLGVSGTTVVVGAGYEDVDSVTHAGALHVFDKVYVGPNLTYDTSNKLSLTGVTTPSTNLTVGTNTYDIGSAKNVYIKDQGTYKFHTNDGNQALLMSNVVSSDPSASYSKTVPLAFHHGTFVDSGDPYGDGSVTVAVANGHVYSDTAPGTYSWGTLSSTTLTVGTPDLEPTSGSPGDPGNTIYTWTPPSVITNGRTLVVAGGGGGGNDMGGGGGAGGLLASSSTNIAKTEHTIVVGGGGTRGYRGNGGQIKGGNGGNSSISGPGITVIGGGGGGSSNENSGYANGVSGGSGGGGSGYGQNSGGTAGGAGTSGQGHAGASRNGNYYPGGGGGAGAVGSANPGHGGDGLEDDILGTSYWWAGGGGGAGHSGSGGNGGKGGGGGGVAYNTTDTSLLGTNDTNGLTTGILPTITAGHSNDKGGSGGKHTGGGGGGGEHNSGENSRGGRGGSGIVVIQVPITRTTPSQVYDNTKTITVTNVPSTLTDVVGKFYKGATAYTIHATEPTSNVIIKNTGTYVSVFTTATQAFLTNAVNVNATPTTTSDDTTIEDEATLVTVTTTTVQEQEPETFSYTGAIQTYTVPDGVTSIKVKCWGAAGGAGAGGKGGAGGYVESNVSVTPGEVLNVTVGQGGKSKGPPQSINGAGGGLSGIFSTWDSSSRDNTHAAAILVAGAGGGGGNAALDGGCGGGETGGSIISSHRPGTQTAGGAWPGKNGGSNGQAGTKLSGGRGGGGAQTAGHSGWPQEVWGNTYGVAGGGDGQNAAGGGGGYYGASGGTDLNGNGGSAAGGSGYTGGDGTHTITEALNLIASQNGSSINPPKTDDEHYQTGIGVALTTSASTNQRSGNGLVVIISTKEVTTTTTTGGITGSTAVPDVTTTDTPSAVLDVAAITTEDPILDLDFTTTLPRNLKRYNGLTNSSIGARFNRTESKKKRVQKSINTDTFSIELTANNMGDSSSSSSTLPVTVVNSGAGTQYTSGWTTGSTSSFAVPNDAPNALYYYSQNDDSAGGSISVSSATTTTHTVTVVSSSAGTQYGLGTSWWTVAGTPGSSGATSTFVAPSNAPSTLYYYCGAHSGMGGAINMVDGPVSSAFAVTVSSSYGSNYFYIDGTQQATISLVRGKTYTFNNNASGSHPMYITTSSDGTIYTSGVTGNSSNGTQYTTGWTTTPSPTYVPGVSGAVSTFAAPSNAPNTLYYYCGAHSGMGGVINMVSGPASSTFAVTVQSVSYGYSSSDKYFIDGTQQATISLVRGKTYTFNNNASGNHPMHFATSSDGTVYDSGVTNGGSSSVTFAVPLNAPSTLYYKCGVHGGMGGTINILGPTASPLDVTVSGGKFVINDDSQATLQLVRGETYVFNQEDNSNGTHPIRLSETSNGTHDIGGSSIITFAVPLNAPSTLYYKCGNHGGMGGTINILGPTESPLDVTVSGGKFVINDDSQATLQLVRGETYVFNQEDNSNGTHPIRLSETSNGTHVTGGSGFYIGGTQKPTLTMVRGNTYTFDQTNASNGSHVLQIATASDGTQYTSGYTTGTFVVPLSAPDTLYYKSSTTSGMGGLINITGSSTSAFVVTFSGGKFSIGGVQQASLSVIRGLTYTFDQTESTNSTHVLLLSSTSDGTRNTGVNKYYISGVETPTLTFIRGNTYTFDQSDSTNTNHPIRLSETSNGTHASGSPSQYTSGWTTTPASPDYVPGDTGATSEFVVDADTPSTLYYYCGAHSGMGGDL